MARKLKSNEEKTEIKNNGEKSGKPPRTMEITVRLESASFRSLLTQVHNDGKLAGFRDGVKYIVTLAENYMVKHEKLSGREVLSTNCSLMPTWWIAALIEALHYEPPYGSAPGEGRLSGAESKKVDG